MFQSSNLVVLALMLAIQFGLSIKAPGSEPMDHNTCRKAIIAMFVQVGASELKAISLRDLKSAAEKLNFFASEVSLLGIYQKFLAEKMF